MTASDCLRSPLNQHGFVADVNAAADAVFDHNIKIKDRRLFVRDPDARTLLKGAIDQLTAMPRPNPSVMEPVNVPRTEKLPVIVRIWPFDGPAHGQGQEVRALLTLNALGPKPGPPSNPSRPGVPEPLDVSTIRAASASQFLSVMSLSNRSNRRVGSAVAHVASLCCISLIIKGLHLIGSDHVHSKQLELFPFAM